MISYSFFIEEHRRKEEKRRDFISIPLNGAFQLHSLIVSCVYEMFQSKSY